MHTTWDQMFATWMRAESHPEIDSAWVFDHFYPIRGDMAGGCLEAWTSLAALAQATDRLQIGSLVNGMPFRHPAVTANMASTLDIISGGRLQLGLGAGWFQEEADAYGISLGVTLTERFDMFDEAVEIIVGLLSNETTTFDGRYYQVTEARNDPKGPQRPHPPIVIGGEGEKRTLRTVARWADHWNARPLGVEEWTHKRAVLEKHCEAVGRDSSEIFCSYMMRFDREAPLDDVRAEMRGLADAGIQKFIFSLPSPHNPEDVDRVVEIAAGL
jgi:F420-dependent oxidoreductase-like protein